MNPFEAIVQVYDPYPPPPPHQTTEQGVMTEIALKQAVVQLWP